MGPLGQWDHWGNGVIGVMGPLRQWGHWGNGVIGAMGPLGQWGNWGNGHLPCLSRISTLHLTADAASAIAMVSASVEAAHSRRT